MAQYKVGNKYLNEDEYEMHAFGVWSFWLFVCGAFIVGFIIQHYVPDDWSKILRYAVVIGTGILAGIALSTLALYVRLLFFMGIFASAVSGIFYWVWTVV
jgi:hypothetical protein